MSEKDRDLNAAGAATARPATSIPIPRSKRGFKGFIQETIAEMKKVHWPSRQETTRLTSVVITVCVGAVLILWLLSMGFEIIIHEVLARKGGV